MTTTRVLPDTPRARARRLWHSAKARAAAKGLDFSIDVEFVARRLERGSCEATGLAFDLIPAGRRATNPLTPTLDRAHPSEGYTPQNTRVVVAAYNQAVGRWGDDILFLIADARARHLRESRR
jgi:hypothetical protein